jgi:RHS repeat-associated protein
MSKFVYDSNGNLLSVTDANNHLTQYTYDNMDRVQTRKDALLNQECYGTFSGGVCQANGYDGNGNLVQFTDRRGKVAKFSYDGLDRMTFAGFGWTSGTNYESTVTYTLDGGNRLRTAVDSISGTITRNYDNLDRLTSDATPQGTVSYTYDNAGRRASLTVPGQSVVNYSFDSANRLTQITQGSATVLLSYDADNRRTSLMLPNGVVATYSYDNASQLSGITYASGSTVLGNLTHGYDLNGRRLKVGGSYARTNLPNAVSATNYNANNQLTTWGTANLFYDLNGNMTSDGTHSYSWDARNRLNQIDTGNTASFTYDPLGRRVTKNILGTSTTFLYDRANAVQEVIGGTNTANSLAGGIDEYFQRTDSAGSRNFLTDALGSTVALTDSTGTTQTSYTFEPFGNTSVSGSTTNSFAYTGRELDPTGLYFYRARYYNSQLQRFISEDPISFAGGDVNLYAYAGNSPNNLTDPTGRSNSLIHFPETYLGARDAGVGVADSILLATLAVFVDAMPGSQKVDAGDTNLHAMAGQLANGKYQGPEEAYQGTIDAVNAFAGLGNVYGDALATHDIADSYSGSHNYAPDYGGPKEGWKPSHAIPDLAYHRGARDAIANYLRCQMHGRKADCDARKYLHPPANPVPTVPPLSY